MRFRLFILVLVFCSFSAPLVAQQSGTSSTGPSVDPAGPQANPPTTPGAAAPASPTPTPPTPPPAAPPAPASTTNYCTDKDKQAIDCRDNLEASAYVGLAIDSFAAGDINQYLNPNDANKIKVRGIAGFDFAYRLYSGPCSEGDRRSGDVTLPCGVTRLKRPQLWVYGETVHGVRSADVDCKANPDLSVCKLFQNNPIFSPDQTLYILRNATSLEAYAGARLEFYTLGPGSRSPANLYLKSEAGFLTVAGAASYPRITLALHWG